MLSVITLVHDRNLLLHDFLCGWAQQQGECDVEILVVRAGGHEDPSETCAHFPELRVRVLELNTDDAETISYSAARNHGASHARGQHLTFADADTIPCPDFAALMHQALDRHDAALTAEIRYLPPGVRYHGDFDAISAQALPHPARPDAPMVDIELSLPHELLWGLSISLRRSTFTQVGGFDERYGGYAGEDTDLAVALRALGRPAGVVGGTTVLHQHHDSWEPPLHQFAATVANAQVFRSKWGEWPMQGWLEQFEDLGLIDRTPQSLRILREPTPDEIDRHRMTAAAPFRTS